MNSTIILIGPMSAGKSTIAKLLAEKLALPHHALDDYRWEYYEEIGYDNDAAGEIMKAEGMAALLRHWKPFEAHSVERILADYPNSVIDFGAGHSVYEDETLFARVQNALAPYPNVILLLPSPDLNASVKILNARFVEMVKDEVPEIADEVLASNEHFVKHPSNFELATIVIYTDGKTPEETCAEILNQLKPSAR